ncbi:MAG: twin-arginine translocase subunit TatC [Planctomycetota bacterium]
MASEREESQTGAGTQAPPNGTGHSRMDPTDDEREQMARMTLGEHLEELRSRLIRVVLFFFTAFILAWIFQEHCLTFIMQPYYSVKGTGERLLGITPADGFFFAVKLCFIGAAFLTVPIAVHQGWAFIAAGLYKHEKRYIQVFFPVSMGLFLAGMTLGYTLMVPLGLEFLMNFNSDFVQTLPTPGSYLTLLIILTLVLGAIFQLPLIMMFFSKLGIVTPETYRKKRRYFILAAFIAAALLTPPDPVTQTLLAIPTVLLYEFGILFSVWSFKPAEKE